MIDFTLAAYERYLGFFLAGQSPIFRFDEFLSAAEPPRRFCLIRHDVDRKPRHALRMAQLEHRLGVKATYYFRAKPSIMVPEIMKTIHDLGHEVGYHYECLSDSNGDVAAALLDFERNLARLRVHVPIKTISMHGRPFKPYDNRDMWNDRLRYQAVMEKSGLLGEIYLSIDYGDIAYINDTGRNWTSQKSNLRDKVLSNVPADFSGSEELTRFLKRADRPNLCFQIHPERWAHHPVDYAVQFARDAVVNLAKGALRIIR